MTRLMLFIVLAHAAIVRAQPGADPATQVARVEAAYENLDYDDAEAMARSALAHIEVFAPDQLIRLHTTLALILYARGDELDASAQFRAALSLDPELRLDPLLVSPVTLAFFEDIKADFSRERAAEQEPANAIRYYVRLEDPRQPATWRSALIPGWGQRYKGETTKGWVLTGLWAVSSASTLVAHVQYQQAHQDYLSETDPTQIDQRRETQDLWYNTRGALALGMVAIWSFSAADALLTGGPTATSGLDVGPAPGGVRLRLRF